MITTLTTTCAFCGAPKDLKQSHIIPKFVFDWLKETSGTGYFRFGQQPNKREQDGLKLPLLCTDCELRFSVWEKLAAENIFKPLHATPSQRLDYRKWLPQFAASVCWRVSTFFSLKGGFAHFSDDMNRSLDKACRRWRDFLIDKEPHPASYELHVLPLDGISETTDRDTPPNMSRYFLRSVDIDAVSSSSSAFIYAKMCHFLLVGFIEMPAAKEWRGTKLHINHGRVGGKVNYVLPGSFVSYLKSRARMMAQAQDSISETQWRRITETCERDLNRAADSESLRAMNFDVTLFGGDSFRTDDDAH